ncbi:unnamed protein product [Gordionus sp. m RMFG-2023]|uniref:trafficking protein particle complex subunit 12-like n=1 Tax=Gordionus sp. m RMFG-2023 TaxID=3053472 RepID=UPI0030E28C99
MSYRENHDNPYIDIWLSSNIINKSFPALQLDLKSSGDILLNLVRYELGETEAKNRANFINEINQQDFESLIINGHFNLALNKINEKISTYPNKLACLPLWILRIILCLRLKSINVVEEEIENFSNFEYPEFYSDTPTQLPDIQHNNLVGTIVPFSFRILYALFPAYKQDYEKAIKRLTGLLQEILQILSKLKTICDDKNDIYYLNGIELWEERQRRVQYCLVACFVSNNDYSTAFEVLTDLIEKSGFARNFEAKMQFSLYLIRILIQLGNLALAQKYLETLQELSTTFPQNAGYIVLHQGLLYMAHNDFDRANTSFSEAISLCPHLKPIAKNNISLSMLYIGKLKEAISLLETELEADPHVMMHECIIFNLCSMYELQSSNNIYYKRLLLQKVSRIKGDGFSPECFKLS